MSQREGKPRTTGITSRLPRGLRGLAHLATLGPRVENITTNLGTMRARLDNNTRKFEALNKQLGTRDEQMSTLGQQVETLSNQLNALSNQLNALSNQVSTLSEQLSLQNERVEVAVQGLEALRARIGELEEHSSTDLKRLAENWEELGRRDPLWAILSLPEKRDGNWNLRKFFESGAKEVAGVLEYVGSLGISQPRRRALDFGCGVGRLTQALCQHFDECCGVDIAPSMVRLAEEYNSYGSRCQYYVNDSDDLSLFEDNTFDFVYSNIVLQHMKPKYSKRYIKEFLRILAPEGVLLFQIPSEPANVGEPLPDPAFKARISPHAPSLVVEAGSQTTIRANVKNVSDVTWHSLGESFNGKHQIKLGNRWLDEDGNEFADGGRTNLPKDLEPEEEIDLDLVINAPSETGNYVIELDMVQELVAWFKDKGSETAKVDVRTVEEVSTTSNRPVAGEGGLVPKIEMYGVPQQEIIELLTSCGGKVVDVQEAFGVGPDSGWLDFRYCVTKA